MRRRAIIGAVLAAAVAAGCGSSSQTTPRDVRDVICEWGRRACEVGRRVCDVTGAPAPGGGR